MVKPYKHSLQKRQLHPSFCEACNLRNSPQQSRLTAYVSLVCSLLEYGATIWDLYLQKDIDRLERIQRQAARFITRDYFSRDHGCATKMLKDLNLPILQERHRNLRLFIFSHYNIYINEYFMIVRGERGEVGIGDGE